MYGKIDENIETIKQLIEDYELTGEQVFLLFLKYFGTAIADDEFLENIKFEIFN